MIALFKDERTKLFNTIRVTNAVYFNACELCTRQRLRAYDAVQLACALSVRDDARQRNAPLPQFVSADRQLLAIADSEGMMTENPENYP